MRAASASDASGPVVATVRLMRSLTRIVLSRPFLPALAVLPAAGVARPPAWRIDPGQ
jgi:hypothetical protein